MMWFMRMIILTGVICLCACQEKDTLEPEVLLDDSTMVIIMTDAFILQSAFGQTYGPIKDSMSEVYTQQLFEKYGIDQDIYDENVSYRMSDPAKMDSIYSRILKRAEYLEDRISRESANLPPVQN